jgi:DNA-binding transcriptional MerR regulator
MEPETASRGEEQSGSDRLYTLSEVSTKTGISMPTLQRYKKTYQSRIPAVGKGRKQRYPESALPVFEELKNENAGRRGRPRKDASAPAAKRGRGAAKAPAAAAGGRRAAASKRPAAAPAKRGRGAAKAAAAQPAKRPGRPPGSGKAAQKAGAQKGSRSGNLMTLTQVSEQTGISYPTLVRYVRLHSDRLPSEGTGRSRRFYPEAVSVFRELRQESGRGGRKAGSGRAAAGRPAGRGRAAASTGAGREEGLSGILQQRLKALEKSQENLEKRFRGFVTSLQKLFR